MSYQVLARKYRPKNFDTLVGQEHVVRALTHALGSGRLHHAYLFTGTRGVGKTTLSRILAKSLNCIGPDGSGGITATPCGVCEACVAIDAGRFVDYIEMDAASNRGVDEMAQLLEQAVYAPSNARFKVYMIDEVHMLTNHAFNSMLKTLEEPPEHVKFILATTDPQKIPVTVLSRCLQFNLKQMPPGHIVSHLDNILGQEGIAFEQPALRLLAQGAHGSMRDALSLTDQAIAYAAGAVTLDAVQGMLGALDQSYLVRLLDALAQQDGADLLAVADEMASRSLSYNNALQDLGTLLHRIALAQTVPAAVPLDLPEHADIMRLAGAFDAEEVQLYYQIAVHGRNELGLAPDEYAGFSMTLLRMLAFRPGNGGAEGVPPPPATGRPLGAPARPAAAMPARAASLAAASHATVTPPAVVAAAAAAAARPPAPAAMARAPAPGASAGAWDDKPVAATAPEPAASAGAWDDKPAAATAPSPAATTGAWDDKPTAATVHAPAAAPAMAPVPVATIPAPQAVAPAPVAIAAPQTAASAGRAAALEAARAASGQRSSGRPAPASVPAAPPASSVASAASAASAAQAAPAVAPVAPAAPAAAAPAAAVARAPAAAPSPSKSPAPWEDAAPQAAPARPAAPPAQAPQPVDEAPEMHDLQDDEMPSWVTEFSDDSAVAAVAADTAAPSTGYSNGGASGNGGNGGNVGAVAAPAAASARPPREYVLVPIAGLDWDGNWPAVAAALPLRGVAQQLAVQTELIECLFDGHATMFKLRVPFETLRSPANVEKLVAALAERFGRKVQVETELGPVWYTASAEAQAYREANQRQAEETIENDAFVQALRREFGAIVVPGSITPAPAPVTIH